MLGAILKKLAAIGLHLPKAAADGGINVKAKGTKITGIRFSSLFHHFVHIDNRTIVINPDKLNGKQRRSLKHLMPDLLDDVGAIMDEKDAPTVEAAAASLPDIREVAKKFIPLIPAPDIPLLNACIFLRLKYENGENVESLKGQIVRVYGARGRNFANLCSAGYLEKVFLPIYDELVKSDPDHPVEVKARFLSLYRTIVNELPWTEFVAGGQKADAVTAHIVEKMNRNIANGVRYMNIHGLGKTNVEKIIAILPEIQKQLGAVCVRIDKDPARIFVRLEIPTQIPN